MQTRHKKYSEQQQQPFEPKSTKHSSSNHPHHMQQEKKNPTPQEPTQKNAPTHEPVHTPAAITQASNTAMEEAKNPPLPLTVMKLSDKKGKQRVEVVVTGEDGQIAVLDLPKDKRKSRYGPLYNRFTEGVQIQSISLAHLMPGMWG